MKKTIALITALAVTACAHPGQNSYNARDVGMNIPVEFGTVVSAREVDIIGQQSGAGVGLGVAAGATAGSFVGNGNGNIAAVLIGAIIGGIAGSATEQAIQDRVGIEYIVRFDSGETQSIVQNVVQQDAEIRAGDRVMVQVQGGYRRVLPSAEPKPEAKKPAKRKAKK